MLSNYQDKIAVLPKLAQHKRLKLFDLATELEHLERLSDALGVVIDAKRDDTLPLAMGGNKVRQLEYYLGPAVEQNKDIVLITGAVQSNFVRLCAAAAIKGGMKCVVQLEARVPRNDAIYLQSGNVLIDRILGAEIVHFAEGENENAADENLEKIATVKTAQGMKPYVIHLGIDHPSLGGLGYVGAAVETWLQYKKLDYMPDHIIIPSGSGLTHAGFLVGARAIGWDVTIHGICVRRDAAQQRSRVVQRSAEIVEMMGGDVAIKDEDILLYDECLAPGYGQINDKVKKAISLAAHTEALMLDPVYSGRTMAGLVDLVDDGIIKQGERVCFLHTGGTPAIFAYQDDLV
ncbi:MAG: D-cysteine desulfhydrase family protein [Rhizobiales bacterium]|nr:D-cysteine desulfhydrase family protein [Hyphomicrobiales bacterium]